MLRSTKLVLLLGIALGLSVAILPTRSFAAVRITQSNDRVRAIVDGYLGLSVVSRTAGSSTAYDSTNNVYSGSFYPMEKTTNFGTTRFEVTCNYLSDPNPDTSARLAGNCSNGWQVTAVSTDNDGTYATMVSTDPNTNFTIPSNSTNLNGTSATWLLKTVPVAKDVVYGGTTYTDITAARTSLTTNYADFYRIPKVATAVAEGNTFRTLGGTSNVYIGAQEFDVVYGFAAGLDSVAGTYVGEITYTLSVKAAS